MAKTGKLSRMREAARLAVVVVFPTPPLPEVATTTHGHGIKTNNSGAVRLSSRYRFSGAPLSWIRRRRT